METAHTSSERKPLLGDVSAANRLRQLFGISAPSSEQTQIDENQINQASLDSIDSDNRTSVALDGNNVVSSEQTPSSGQGTSNSNAQSPIPCAGIFEKTDEVSLEEIVPEMYSAWERFKDRFHGVTLDCFTTKQLYAMHLAWKKVTRGRHCPSQPHIVAEAIAASMARWFHPGFNGVEYEYYENYHQSAPVTKARLAVNLLREWERITEGFGFPSRYIETIFEGSDEQLATASQSRLRKVEMYDKVHDFILKPGLQIFLHTLLIIWPISILIVGSKYTECPMIHPLSYLLVILGVVGCSAILARLALMYLTARYRYTYNWFWEWTMLRVLEFAFLIVFIAEAYYFFIAHPIAEPYPNQCVRNFYNVAVVINYVSVALTSTYVLVYSIIICLNQINIWHWVLKYL